MIAQKIIGPDEQALIKNEVNSAEQLTSGEIRVFVEDHTADSALDRAVFLFDEQGMHKTELRNGILIYVALKDKKFSVIGDYGIHEKVGEKFWDGIRDEMQNQFKQGKFVEGIIDGIREAGNALKEYFPRLSDDINELPNDVIFGKGKGKDEN